MQLNKMERYHNLGNLPAAGDSLRAYRNYRIVDTNNQEIGHCLSYWMAMNLNTRRPIENSANCVRHKI